MSGKYRRGQARPSASRRSDPEQTFLKFDEEVGFDVIEKLDEIGKAHGGTVSQAALNWLSAKPAVTSVIIGARTPKQLQDNLKGLDWEMDEEEVDALDAISPLPHVYPYWMIKGFHTRR